MKLSTINTGLFKLDGGAMYGVVPKSLWKKLNPPDDNNLCTWAARCLLIQTEGRNILVDTGIGNKQNEKWRSHFEPHGEATLLGSLKDHNLDPEDITDVFLTHLHFDHCGGALYIDDNGDPLPTFPNARYWTNKAHYDWAYKPNDREKASFLKENFVPLHEQGLLHFTDTPDLQEWIPGIRIQYMYGHTEAMMLLHIQVQDKTVIYCADLLPSHTHIRMPYVMAYDVRPLQTLKEKRPFLEAAAARQAILFFEHDPVTECATVIMDERGRFKIEQTMTLREALSDY